MDDLRAVPYGRGGRYWRVWLPELQRFEHLGPADSVPAKVKLAKLQAERRVKQFTRAAPKLLVCELAADYLLWAKEEYSPSHYGQLNRAFEELLAEHERLPVEQFGPVLLESFQKRLADLEYSICYIGHMVKAIRAGWKWAARRELIPVERYNALRVVPCLKPGRSRAKESKPISPVSNADVDATIRHALPPVAAMIRLQRLAGMRPQDVCGLRPCDIHRGGQVNVPGGGTIDLDALGGVWLYLPAKHKGTWRGKKKLVMIGPTGQSVLLPYLDRGAEEFCFSPAESMRVFRERGRAERAARGGGSGGNRKPASKNPTRTPTARYTTGSYGRAIKRAAKAAGVPPWNANQLRHAAGTEIRSKFGLEGARAVLGHTDPRTTMIYAPEDAETAADVMRKIG